jgi:hypothetical protein
LVRIGRITWSIGQDLVRIGRPILTLGIRRSSTNNPTNPTNPHVTSGVCSPVPSESLSPSRPSPSEHCIWPAEPSFTASSGSCPLPHSFFPAYITTSISLQPRPSSPPPELQPLSCHHHHQQQQQQPRGRSKDSKNGPNAGKNGRPIGRLKEDTRPSGEGEYECKVVARTPSDAALSQPMYAELYMLICRGAPVLPKVCAIPNQNPLPRLFSSFNLLPPLSPLSFPVCRHCPPRRSYAAWSSTLHRTHPVRCRLSASCSRPSARRLPACRHASLSALSSLQPRLPQPRRPEPFLPTPPCSLSSVSSPLLSARRLAVCRRSEHSRLAACHRIGDHPSATCTPVDRRRPDSHQRQQRTRPPE